MKCPECEKLGIIPLYIMLVVGADIFQCNYGHYFKVERKDQNTCDFCGETSHLTENCPHAVDLKAAHEYQTMR